MARVVRIEGQTSDVRRISGTLGQSDVEAARLRAKAAAIAHPIDTGQTSTSEGQAIDLSGVLFARVTGLSNISAIGGSPRSGASTAGGAGAETAPVTGRVEGGGKTNTGAIGG